MISSLKLTADMLLLEDIVDARIDFSSLLLLFPIKFLTIWAHFCPKPSHVNNQNFFDDIVKVDYKFSPCVLLPCETEVIVACVLVPVTHHPLLYQATISNIPLEIWQKVHGGSGLDASCKGLLLGWQNFAGIIRTTARSWLVVIALASCTFCSNTAQEFFPFKMTSVAPLWQAIKCNLFLTG